MITKFVINKEQIMNISLTPAMEKYINDKVSSGLYTSVSELVREAIRLLIAKDSVSPERIAMLNEEIEKGWNDMLDGRVMSGEEALKKLRARYE